VEGPEALANTFHFLVVTIYSFSAGDYAIRPPGMRHGPWRTDEGVTTFESRYYSR